MGGYDRAARADRELCQGGVAGMVAADRPAGAASNHGHTPVARVHHFVGGLDPRLARVAGVKRQVQVGLTGGRPPARIRTSEYCLDEIVLGSVRLRHSSLRFL